MSDEMNEMHHSHSIQEDTLNVQKRIMTVEETVIQHDKRIAMVEYVQTDLKAIIKQLAGLQADQSKQLMFNESTILAIKDRTDVLSEHMEKASDRLSVKQEQSDDRLGKIENRVEQQDTKWKVLQAIMIASLGIALSVLAQRLMIMFH